MLGRRLCAPRLVSFVGCGSGFESVSARQTGFLGSEYSLSRFGLSCGTNPHVPRKYGSVRVDFVDGDPEDHLAAVRQTRPSAPLAKRLARSAPQRPPPTTRRLITRADAKCRSFASVLRQAARASSETRSHVVACMLGRACIRASQLSRLACGAPRTDHSGVRVNNSTAGATIRSASEIASPAK